MDEAGQVRGIFPFDIEQSLGHVLWDQNWRFSNRSTVQTSISTILTSLSAASS